MMNYVRRNLQTIMWILVILIVPTFILWGVGTRSRAQGYPYAGILSGKKVSWEGYRQSWLACRNQLFYTYGPSFRDLVQSVDLDEEAWTRLTLLQEAGRRNIHVPDDWVRNEILAIPLFKQSGAFRQDLYQEWVERSLQMSPRAFEEELRDTLVLEVLRQQVTQEVFVSDSEILKEYKKRWGRAKLSLAVRETQSLADAIQPTDAELADWYARNGERFKTAGQWDIAYVAFRFAEFESQVELPKEEGGALQDPTSGTAPDELLQEKVRELARTKAREEADRVFQGMLEADDPAAYLAEQGLVRVETGLVSEDSTLESIGSAYRFFRAAKELKAGEMSDPITNETGVFIITDIVESLPPAIPPLDAVRSEALTRMKEELALAQARKQMDQDQAEIDFKMAQGVSFGEAVQALDGLTLIQTDWISQLDEIPGWGRDLSLLENAFNLEEKTLSQAIESEGKLALVWLEAFEAVDEEQLASKRDELLEDLKTRASLVYYNAWVEELKKKADLKSFVDEAT